VENGLAEPSTVAHPPEGRYIARTLVRVHREVPVRVLNATGPDQLTKGPGTLYATQAGDSTRCGTTTGPRYYPDVAGRDCWGQAKPE
jgi:hypothetical protein